jgi:ribosome biogenesis GTPase
MESVGEVISVAKTGFFVNQGGERIFCIVNNSFQGDEKPVVGDVVVIQKKDDQHLITAIKPRKSFIGRYDFYKERYQGFAANVDFIFVVTSANNEFSPNRIRRFLALSGSQDVKKVVVLTKIDLNKKWQSYADTIKNDLGVEYIAINALDTNQVKQIVKAVKKGESILLLGSSGVGKSTIINTLCGTNLKTGDTKGQRFSDKGKHTTSARNMYYTRCGRKIIDVPGVKIVGVESEVALGSEVFERITSLATECKFRNCRHQTEIGCAVKAAIEAGKLSSDELAVYTQIIGEENARKR